MENNTIKITNFENFEEISDKIKNKSVPTDKDKENLLHKLNKQLNEDEHLYIFTEILQNLEKRIYSITENCTLFDLNDVPNESFWKIYYYAQLFISNHERQKDLDKANAEHLTEGDLFKEKIKQDLEKIIKDQTHQSQEDIDKLSPYEKLRIGALSQCSYSTYSQKNIETSDYNLTLPDDKRLEKTIYSDSFRHRWKPEDKNSQVTNEPINHKKEFVSETASANDADDVEDAEDAEDVEDDDDMMLNEDYENSEEKPMDNETEKAELDRLKNQLLKAPKMKLSLKVTQLNYEEPCEDDEDD
jgi:hypothetical protein